MNIKTDNIRLITTGFLLTFFSSFGQTFLISLYVPDIIQSFGLNNSLFGSIYGSATVLSAVALLYAGNLIDAWNLKKYTIVAILILSVSCIVVSFSFNSIMLFAGIWGLRFSGQGLLTHISSTSISKHFTAGRGKALSISSLGYSAGEGVFPVIVSSVIIWLGWRYSMLLSGISVAVILLPLTAAVLGGSSYKDEEKNNVKSGDVYKRSRLFRDMKFYIIAYNTFILSFVVTGLFFYQIRLASDKGWTVEWMAACFIAYAAGRAVFSIISGPMIDRYTAVSMFPYYLLPYSAGLAAAAFFSHYMIAPFYLILTGISIGMSGTVRTAVMAEVFGTKNIGGVRSVFAMISVLSTALSPALFGFMLDNSISFKTIILLSLAGVMLSNITGFFLIRFIEAKKI